MPINQGFGQPTCAASSSIISLDRNPFKGGIPAMDSEAMAAMVKVTGMRVRRPPRRRRSRVCASWSTIPAVMKSAALKTAWFKIWKIATVAASGVPKPRSMVIRPRWLTVEKARSAFRSSL